MPTRLIATLILIVTLAACRQAPRPTPILPRDVPSPTFMPVIPTATATQLTTPIPTADLWSATAIPLYLTPTVTATPDPDSDDPVPPISPNSVSVAPKIHTLSVTPSEGVKAGDVVQASWQAEGDRAQLCITAYDYYGGECQTVPLSGAQDLMIRQWEGIVIVTLKVWGQNAAEAETGYRLSLGCTHAWVWDSLDNSKRCPGPSELIVGAAQPFEHGWMVWTGNHYYILFDRPSDWGIPLTYDIEEVPDPLEITRDTAAQYTAPDGLYAPLSGFGLVWRGDVSLSPGYTTDLGWARTPETRWEAYVQCWSLKGYVGASGGISECLFVHPSRGLIAIVRDGIQFYWEFVS